MTDEAELPEDEFEGEEEEEFSSPVPVILCAGDVAIPDAEYLARDSGVQGVIAIRVTENLDVEYLDGETRLWMNAAVPAGPTRNKH